ncbi:hypothetical protein BBOV_III011370 [Babesia bovis T2Bo]|uniref:Uncharacterized protein n=1 Tax=Babesia bovis TaxID=5865 RepID=A7AQ55_BABBO|nr:hypothetical protein BBOV_III011370 [Babesia bovis T2Bo]EDO08689.1 hypothetical protein BBOV_III011370 [Babesia bovis T2Bo]|eukprot:XP_001612257.1 hypothetical protein [Babesia bovis T2Bo]
MAIFKFFITILMVCSIYIRLISGIELNLNKLEFSENVRQAYGYFPQNGHYRLLDVENDKHVSIMFAHQLLSSPTLIGQPVVRIYVEEFRRYKRYLLRITYVGDAVSEVVKTIHLEKHDEVVYLSSHETLMNFVNGPIRIAMDFNYDYINPVIDYYIETTRGNPSIKYLVGNELPNDEESSHSRLWYGKGEFIISPIKNFDKFSSMLGGPTTYIIGSITSITPYRDINIIYITVSGRGDMEYKLYIPPANLDVFQPRNMLTNEDHSQWPLLYGAASEIRHIVIDISRKTFPDKNVVVVENLRRGDWIYGQHLLLPGHNLGHVSVEVKHVHVGIDIYKSPENEKVTHVEIFKYVVEPLTYVVVNVLDLSVTGYPVIRHVFQFNNNITSPGYKLVVLPDLKECLDNLYNIPTAATGLDYDEYRLF